MDFKELISKEAETRNDSEVSKKLEINKKLNENKKKVFDLMSYITLFQEDLIKRLDDSKNPSKEAMIIPVQIHRLKDSVIIFSDSDSDISSSFPNEFIDQIKSMSESEFVIEGMIVKLNEKYLISVDDVLYLNESLIEKPLAERTKLVDHLKLRAL